MFEIVQDALVLIVTGWVLFLFRFGFQNPFPVEGPDKKLNQWAYYTWTALAGVTFLIILRDLIIRLGQS